MESNVKSHESADIRTTTKEDGCTNSKQVATGKRRLLGLKNIHSGNVLTLSRFRFLNGKQCNIA